MANTTNLNLAKPAGTDKALVSVLNSNSDKIDAWAGSTNQALSALNSNMTTQNVSYTYNTTSAEEVSGETFVKRIGNVISFNLSFTSKVSSSNALSIITYDSSLPVLSGNGYVFAYNMTDGTWSRGYSSSRTINVFNLVSGKHYLIDAVLTLS